MMFLRMNDTQILDADQGIVYTLKSYDGIEGIGLARLVVERLGYEDTGYVATSYNPKFSKSEYHQEKRNSERAKAIFKHLEGLCDQEIEIALGTVPAPDSPF